MGYKIIVDSSANLQVLPGPAEFASVPLKIIAGDREFVDDRDLDVEQMVESLRTYKGKSGTACPGVADWLEAFGDAEGILCITITSNLSGSWNAARLAKEDYESQYPDRQVFVIDTLSTGGEMQLLARKAQELLGTGIAFGDVCRHTEAYLQKTGLMFSLESLRNLANNGRVSPVTAKLAGVLGIRVVGKASDRGTLEPTDKCRGERKALQTLLSRMKEQGYQGGRMVIDHCMNETAALQLKGLVTQDFPNADIAVGQTRGLCSFYAEQGGMIIGYEKG